MQLSDLTLAGFLCFGAVRIFAYVPQIVRVARDQNGASAISYTTWGTWTLANLATALYAAVNLRDPYLAAISCIYAMCCVCVLSLTAVKRGRHGRQEDAGQSRVEAEQDAAWNATRNLVANEAARLHAGMRVSHDFERRLAEQRNRHLRLGVRKWIE